LAKFVQEPIMRPTAALILCLLYGAVAPIATPAHAGEQLSPAALTAIKDMRTGDMAKLAFHEAPRDALSTPFLTEDGAETTLPAIAARTGRVTVANLWATWCGPCRKEMPSLDRLRAALAPDGIDVIAVNVERKGLIKARNFYGKYGIESLEVFADQDGELPRRLGVIGYPVTLVLDAEGREIARMQGDAEWDSPEAQALLRRIAAETAPKS
jgi:thiol-disulfide isomerase/thioredoxin